MLTELNKSFQPILSTIKNIIVEKKNYPAKLSKT